ncbi:MAG: class I SAM-dependent methyltransferase [Giesbergeria sp.]
MKGEQARYGESSLPLTGGSAEATRYGGYRLEATEASGLLVGMVPHGARVLDVGCGDGTMSVMLRDHRNATVVGLEPNPERAAAALARGLTVLQMELNGSVIEQTSEFDVVLFADVLEHMTDPLAALEAVSRMLLPGGVVVASVPNVAHWTVRLNLLRGRFDYSEVGIMDSMHLRWFTRASFLRLFEAAGYSVVEARASTGLWVWDYKCRWPWRWFSDSRRKWIVQRAAAKWPTLFGYQHIVKAVPRKLAAGNVMDGGR